MVVAAGLAACGQDKGPTEPPPVVIAVEISPAAVTLTALGATRQLTAVAKDANSNPVAGKTFRWSSSAPSIATVDSVTGVVTAVDNGVATISARVEGKAGQAEVTVAQEVGSVSVTPEMASLNSIGATQAFLATAKDANNNPVAGVKFLWTSSNPSTATVDSTGLATAKANGVTTITAAARGVPGNAALSVTQAPAKLAFAVQPTDATGGAVLTPAVEVAIQDSRGNTVVRATNAVTLTMGANPSGATLLGTTTVDAVNGIAIFNDLSIQRAAVGYTLAATATGLAATTSLPFNIVAAAPVRLGFTVQPTNATAGVAISPAVAVAIEDAFGNTVPTATNAVTVTLGANPGGATLAGTTTVNAANGVTRFSDLSLQRAGTGYTLAATADGLEAATSASFTVEPAAAAQLAFAVQPSNALVRKALTPAVAVAVEDSFGNIVTTATNAVTVAIGTNPSGGTLSGTMTRNAVSGVATFTDLSIDRPGVGYTLVATASSLIGATSAPFDITVLLTFATVAAGSVHSCGVTPGGAAYCWGNNSGGRLGNGTTSSSAVPVAVLGGLTFANLSAGQKNTCGVAVGGAAYCWGNNESGQNGDGTTTNSSTPSAVSGGLSFSTVSAGGNHSCGATSGGAAYCWGSNTGGQLGAGWPWIMSSPTPIGVSGGITFATVSAGGVHTCGVTSDGAAYCWGTNTDGQLGTGTGFFGRPASSPTPAAVLGGLTFTAISAGQSHTCGLTSSGAAYCWGSNGIGQLGDGTTTSRTTPVLVLGGLTFKTVSAGGGHSCGVTLGGAVYCWGLNTSGELGDGTTTNSATPVAVSGGLTFAAVSAGQSHTCAVTPDGAAYCWGRNDAGQLGNGATVNSNVPVLVQ